MKENDIILFRDGLSYLITKERLCLADMNVMILKASTN